MHYGQSFRWIEQHLPIETGASTLPAWPPFRTPRAIFLTMRRCGLAEHSTIVEITISKIPEETSRPTAPIPSDRLSGRSTRFHFAGMTQNSDPSRDLHDDAAMRAGGAFHDQASRGFEDSLGKMQKTTRVRE